MLHRLTAFGLGMVAAGTISHAEAQAPAIAGTWKLNVEESEDAREKMQLAMRGEQATEFGRGYRGGGRPSVGAGSVDGRRGGGPPGAAAPSGGGGMGGGGGGGPMGRVMRGAQQITIAVSDTMIVISDGGEQPQHIYLDGRPMREPNIPLPAVVTCTWKDGKLTLDKKMGETESVRETYSIDKKKNRLVVEMKATSARFQRPLDVKRVYDPAG